jgi:hypothetical protein
VRCDGDQAEIGAANAFAVEQLATRLDGHIAHALGAVLGRRVQCRYISLIKLLGAEPDAADDQPTPLPVHQDERQPRVPPGGRP